MRRDSKFNFKFTINVGLITGAGLTGPREPEPIDPEEAIEAIETAILGDPRFDEPRLSEVAEVKTKVYPAGLFPWLDEPTLVAEITGGRIDAAELYERVEWVSSDTDQWAIPLFDWQTKKGTMVLHKRPYNQRNPWGDVPFDPQYFLTINGESLADYLNREEQNND